MLSSMRFFKRFYSILYIINGFHSWLGNSPNGQWIQKSSNSRDIKLVLNSENYSFYKKEENTKNMSNATLRLIFHYLQICLKAPKFLNDTIF